MIPASRGKRDLIKAQAMRLFVEQGVDAVSVRDIAAACAMKPSNLYAHFASKDALIAELFRAGCAEYGAVLRDAAAVSAPFPERLRHMVFAMCRLHDEDTVRFRFLLMVRPEVLAKVPGDDRNPVDILCRTVARAMDDGEIPRREPELMTMALIGLIVQPATGCLHGRLSGDLGGRAEEIAGMCWRALS